jgi:hypothetical protein
LRSLAGERDLFLPLEGDGDLDFLGFPPILVAFLASESAFPSSGSASTIFWSVLTERANCSGDYQPKTIEDNLSASAFEAISRPMVDRMVCDVLRQFPSLLEMDLKDYASSPHAQLEYILAESTPAEFSLFEFFSTYCRNMQQFLT